MDILSLAAGVATGLVLAALGFTYKTIAAWVEARLKVAEAELQSLEAQAVAHRALASAVAAGKITASVPTPATPAAPAPAAPVAPVAPAAPAAPAA
jgi:arylamine N-acetyltransferase